ncbi:MAG: zinc-ribbon domain-containing protein, partial [Wujia sp.]
LTTKEYPQINDSKNVTIKESACPYCNNRLVAPNVNSFNITQPEIYKEWDTMANNLLDIYADQISDRNHKLVWWKCSQGHQYTMSPSNKVYFKRRNRETCPFCKGLRRNKRHFI